MIKRKPLSTSLVALAAIVLAASNSYGQRPLPTTEDFTNLLRTCATSAKVDVSANLVGSISSIYSGQRTSGAASFVSDSGFLDLLKILPESERLKAYELYVKCIKDIMGKG
jgi:hypothetical protein